MRKKIHVAVVYNRPVTDGPEAGIGCTAGGGTGALCGLMRTTWPVRCDDLSSFRKSTDSSNGEETLNCAKYLAI